MAATQQSIKGLTIGVPTAFYVDDLDAEVARVLDETVAVLKREGANIVQVELPDQRQLTAACQFVLAIEAAAFHKRWMIERPAGLRRAGADAAAERAGDTRPCPISKRCAGAVRRWPRILRRSPASMP